MMSLLASFDDLRRCTNVLTDGTAEEEFLKFVKNQDEIRIKWLKAIQEAQRLQKELDASLRNMADLETKLFHARKFVEIEKKARKEAEFDRDQMEKKIMAVADILKNEKHINEETRERIAFLNSYQKKRRSHIEEKENDINSTGSFLSDLSLTTYSEEDFLDARASRQFKKHRPSHPRSSGVFVGNKRTRVSIDGNGKSKRSSKQMEIGASDKIVARTRVSIPAQGEGPIHAESVIEAVPPENDKYIDKENKPNNFQDLRSPPKKSPKQKFHTPTPSAPPLYEFNVNKINTPSRNMMRSHNFTQKPFIKPDTCVHCQKKIRFGLTGWKCQDCRICVHSGCKDSLKITCVPQGSNTPHGTLGSITDFAPSIPPKIPGIVVHCVNEIETRGLNEVGIYRVSGSEREVKHLKEKFLRGKSTPNLSTIDIHVLCGCVKDFLRSLKEPLIPTNLWKDFSNAVQNISQEEVKSNLYRAISSLPEANRDTLAFLILHFQRVAECDEIKMPIENIARVFGPTIVGYSNAEPDQNSMYAETVIQYSVMEKLMKISAEYWTQFVSIETDRLYSTPRTDDSKLTYGSTMKKLKRRERKFYPTPPYPSSSKK